MSTVNGVSGGEEELQVLVGNESVKTPPSTRDMPQHWTETNGFKLGIAAAYVFLWSSNSIVVRNSRTKNVEGGEKGGYAYNFVFVVLLVEITKFTSALLACLSQGVSIFPHLRLGVWYGAPAIIYALYNSLMFVNLASFDVGSYKLVMNIRIAFTGILFQRAFNKPLGPVRWVALTILALGVVVMQLGKIDNVGNLFSFALLLVAFQAFLSALGGVANEYLLKKTELPFALQNLFMYGWSIVINIVMMYWKQPDISLTDMKHVFQEWSILIVILSSAVAGLSTSVLLKYLNVVIKSFCTACEMLLAGLMGWYVFGEPITFPSFVAMGCVSVAIWVYNTADEWQRQYFPGYDPKVHSVPQELLGFVTSRLFGGSAGASSVRP